MGMSYWTITVHGPDQKYIIACVADWMYDIVVTPTVGANTAVFVDQYQVDYSGVTEYLYDEGGGFYEGSAFIEHNAGHSVHDFSLNLSAALRCTVLATEVLDDDVMVYWLLDKGVLVNQYGNRHLEWLGDEQPLVADEPTGGDAALLCRLFDVPAVAEEVRQLLAQERFVCESERDQAFRRALQLPQYIIGGIQREYFYVSFPEAVMQADTDKREGNMPRMIRTGRRRTQCP